MNPLIYPRCPQVLVALCLLIFGPGLAQAVTVQELTVNPTEIVNISTTIYPTGGSPYSWTGNVYAGVNKLLVDGVAMDGFCIDPFHFSANSSLYSFTPLTNAPKSPGGPMGLNEATLIERLWASYYSPSMSAADAAGLQIAIWDVVGGTTFQLNGFDYGASGFLAYVTDTSAYTYSGTRAHLVGLTGPGQDYVVPGVPDGGSTAGMLGLTFVLISMARWGSMRRQALTADKTFAS